MTVIKTIGHQDRVLIISNYGIMRIAEAHYTGKDSVSVPTQEDRIAALERKVAMLELLRSQDERKAEEALPPAQARNMREINENLTMLLGVTSSQGGDIKRIKEDVSSIKDRLDRLETQSNEHTGRFDHVEALLTQILARLPEQG
jgi:chromosome segregation ATPase